QNLVVGNLIGTTANGLAGLGNGLEGIKIFGAAGATGHKNIIGGATPRARNVISGDGIEGIPIEGAHPDSGQSKLVEGNYTGTDITGTTGLGRQVGIGVAGNYNTIGGSTAGARNIISGNSSGIVIHNGFPGPFFGNAIQGNYIGTDFSGTQAVPNGA